MAMKTVLCLLAFTASCLAAEPKPQPVTDELMQKLVKLADKWGLPPLRPSSQLYLIENGSFRVGDEPATDLYILGYREPGKPPQMRVGFELKELGKFRKVAPVDDPDSLPFEQICGENDNLHGLLVAVQLLRSGQQKAAQKLLEKSINIENRHGYVSLPDTSLEALLAHCFVCQFDQELYKPRPNLAQCKQRIERVLADVPINQAIYKELLASLQASVAHPVSPPHSVERAIDEYLLSGARHSETAKLIVNDCWPGEENLFKFGFQAVPTLLKQRHSPRFTNFYTPTINNIIGHRWNAAEAIQGHLQDLANEQFARPNEDDEEDKKRFDKEFDLWWERAAAMGEQEYVKKYTIQQEGDGQCRISSPLLYLARTRYPESLPGMYLRLLQTDEYSEQVLKYLMASKAISDKQKHELLLAGIATKRPAHRNAALEQLLKIDRRAGEKILLDLLQHIPPHVEKKGEDVIRQNVGLAGMVGESSSEVLWQEFEASLKRVEPIIAMELIYCLEPNPAGMLRFRQLDKPYQDSQVLRGKQPSGFFAGHMHDEITMRNYLHLQWAKWLELDIEDPKEESTDEEWEAYRAQVAAEIAKWEKQASAKQPSNKAP